MAAIKRSGTKPEVMLRSALHRQGLRFRKDLRIKIEDRGVRPDVVFTKARVAVFVDGCFWHCCPEHGRQPNVNTDYWTPKLRRNYERDLRDTALLEGAGWLVVRIWEHENVDYAAGIVAETLRAVAVSS